MKDLDRIPKVGEILHFWDDGKSSPSRHYLCKIEEIIPFEDIKNVMITRTEGEDNNHLYDVQLTLEQIWQDEVNECDWLYAKETDVIIKASCPNYDDDSLYFARTLDGGWFSMNVTSWWQSGRLDIDQKIFDSIIDEIKSNPKWYKHPDEFIAEYNEVTYEKK